MNTPKVSVIIPIYNVERYIERCARSLFEQTLNDLEYIFIDDCTPDKSVDILESVLKEYPHRIPQTQIIRLPQNIGLPSVRKKGISIAKGEYIAHCDSDDWVERNMYELMYNEALKNNYDIVRCLFTRCNETFSKKCYIIPAEIYTQKEKLLSYQLIGYDHSSHWDKIVSRKLFIDNVIVYPTLNMFEDYVVTTQLIYYSNKIGYIDRVLYYYYQNPNSICHESGEDKNIASQYSKEITNLKYSVRESLLPLIDNRVYWQMWLNTYPEITIFKLSGIKKKVSYVLVYLRIYTPIKKLYKKIFNV